MSIILLNGHCTISTNVRYTLTIAKENYFSVSFMPVVLPIIHKTLFLRSKSRVLQELKSGNLGSK